MTWRDLQGLGVLLKDANRFQEGEAKLREAIRLREEHRQAAGCNRGRQAGPGDSRYQLGALLARRGSATAEDLAAYRAALEVQEALVKQFGDRPEFRTKLVRYRNNLAILQRALGSLSESEATLRATLDLLRPSIESPDPLPGAEVAGCSCLQQSGLAVAPEQTRLTTKRPRIFTGAGSPP